MAFNLAADDVKTNFDGVNGSIFNDRLTGDDSGVTLNGRQGDDTLLS